MFSYEEYLEKLKAVEEKEEDEDIVKLMTWKEVSKKLQEKSIEASTSFK